MTEGKDPVTGRFIVGNDQWIDNLLAHKYSEPPKYETAGELAEDIARYFQYVNDFPLSEEKAQLNKDGDWAIHQTPKMRAMTIGGMCAHLGFTIRSWQKWRTTREDLAEVMEYAEGCIRAQKIEGAAAGMLNAIIVAREVGLADVKTVSGTEGGDPIRIEETYTDKERVRRLAFVLREAMEKEQKEEQPDD